MTFVLMFQLWVPGRVRGLPDSQVPCPLQRGLREQRRGRGGGDERRLGAGARNRLPQAPDLKEILISREQAHQDHHQETYQKVRVWHEFNLQLRKQCAYVILTPARLSGSSHWTKMGSN